MEMGIARAPSPEKERKSPAGFTCNTTSDCQEGLVCKEDSVRTTGGAFKNLRTCTPVLGGPIPLANGTAIAEAHGNGGTCKDTTDCAAGLMCWARRCVPLLGGARAYCNLPR